MDNLSAGTRFLLWSKGRTYQPIAQRRFVLRNDDSDISDTDSDGYPKTGCFPAGIAVCFASELLSGFVRNQCLLSIGITAWNGSEYADYAYPLWFSFLGHSKEAESVA